MMTYNDLAVLAVVENLRRKEAMGANENYGEARGGGGWTYRLRIKSVCSESLHLQ